MLSFFRPKNVSFGTKAVPPTPCRGVVWAQGLQLLPRELDVIDQKE